MFVRLLACLFCLAAFAAAARADEALEVLPLQHRSADEIIPLLRPLLEPGGALTGMQGNLILRASRANREQIRQALAALDILPLSLRITVRQRLDSTGARQSAELHGNVASEHATLRAPPGGTGGTRVEIGGADGRLGVRLDERSLDQMSRVTQQLRVTDGGRALIHAGVELPLTLTETVVGPRGRSVRESVVFRDVGSGFYVAPRVVGERVTLDIHPVQQTFASPQVVVGQSLHTTVSGRLGEWIALGGGDSLETRETGQLAGTHTATRRESRQVWLKVERAD